MIIFLGDKPSEKNLDQNIPFVGTQSYRKLLEWIWKMNLDITQVGISNTSDFFKRFTVREIQNAKIIVLGNNAEEYIKDIQIGVKWECSMVNPTTGLDHYIQSYKQTYDLKYFKLPHPSGANPKANSSSELDGLLKKCEQWIKNEN